MTLLKDLLPIPDRVHKGAFVLRLAEGIQHADETLRDYVVTPQLAACFDDALSFIRKALETRSSQASYLDGSFGAGKSHLMAVLHLILQGNPKAKSIPDLSSALVKHNAWIEGKKFLLVPYHMIGARSMEAGILGGYAEFIRKTHPKAPVPAVFKAEGLFADARRLRGRLGDAAFFAQLNEAHEAESTGWGALEAPWDAGRFEDAVRVPPVPESDRNFAPSEARRQLLSALIKSFFSSFTAVNLSEGEAYIALDAGLAVLSQHARDLGYDALILFLDELILWLASHAADLRFVHQEGQKLVKLVEAQSADRPVPIVSFIARQRDLRDLIGENVPGADKLNFSDALKHWEGRFHRITLEDRNLPEIASRRLLVARSEGARKELDLAFEETAKVREEVMNALLTTKYDRGIFRKVYPFSPALVDTLVGVSSVLQRERTALRVMLQLLVDQRETLRLGDLVPVGDLFDVIAHGDEAFTEDMQIHFGNAKRLYHEKLLPVLEKQHQARREDLEKMPWDDPRRTAFRNDDRLVKTLLLAALVPGVESLRGLTASRLAALNHGTIVTPIPGREGQEVLRRCRAWNAEAGEIRISGEGTNPTISVLLSGVDTESIIAKAAREDNSGNRRRLVRRMLFGAMGLEDRDEIFITHGFVWRNTHRTCEVIYGNVRELLDPSFEDPPEGWRLVIDFPFDEPGHTPHEDVSRLEELRSRRPQGSRCLVWIPAFLSRDAQVDLGRLVVLEHVLAGQRYEDYATHLSLQDRAAARTLLENQRDSLRGRVLMHLEAAYGLSSSTESIDASHELSEHFHATFPGFQPRRPAAAGFADAMLGLLAQALEQELPAHPRFEAEVKLGNLRKVYEEVHKAVVSGDERWEVDKSLRKLVRDIANPLLLGEMHETAFVLGHHWKEHFTRKMALSGTAPTVKQLREWTDEPRPMGLPREVQNLVILIFAEQTDHELFHHGAPYEASLTDLPDALELRKPALPSEQDWKLAYERGGKILGVAVSPLLNAVNVKTLETGVRQKVSEAREPVRKLSRLLEARLGDGADGSSRLRTAKATLALLEALADAEPKDVVAVLAKAAIATSEAAMGECFRKASSLAERIEATSWEIFEAAGRLRDGRQAAAGEILAGVGRALEEDEHAVPLATALQKAQARAVGLLSEDTGPVPPRPPPDGPGEPGTVDERRGSEKDLDLAAARRVLDRIEKDLGRDEAARIAISWRIVPEGDVVPNSGSGDSRAKP
ncbi:MAG: phage resistance protein [Planctomycetes bacterium]|nr:phage resistance protein [Planctomycetota bacterium]